MLALGAAAPAWPQPCRARRADNAACATLNPMIWMGLPPSPPVSAAPVPPALPCIDPDAPLQFVINAASGQHELPATRRLIEDGLAAAGRSGDFHLPRRGALALSAAQAARTARKHHSAVVAVGGDGTLNAVAQAAHAEGCAMGVLPQGTFNYFARTHGIPADLAQALAALLVAVPVAVQVGQVNDRLFLVNASLGLYPDLLQDREAYKARFGRSRLVAFGAALATVLGHHRRLRQRNETDGRLREVSTPTLFVGNNRLQLEQVGLPQAPALDDGQLAAVVLRPVGTWALLGLLARGAMGRLGEADTVDSFSCQRLLVRPRLAWAGRSVKVAYDGEIGRLRLPLDFRVADRALVLLKAPGGPAATGLAQGAA